jgi:hypothetical protein
VSAQAAAAGAQEEAQQQLGAELEAVKQERGGSVAVVVVVVVGREGGRGKSSAVFTPQISTGGCHISVVFSNTQQSSLLLCHWHALQQFGGGC